MTSFNDNLLAAWGQPAIGKSLGASDAPVWALDLPTLTADANKALLHQREALRRDQDDIEAAVVRLSTFVESWNPNAPDTAKSLGESTPEDRLSAALTHAPSVQSKDLFDPLTQAKEEFDVFLARVRDLTSNFARIETSTDGTHIANTVVGWTGDFQTVWQDSLRVEQMTLHRQNVRVALARRAMLMRLVVVISSGAVKIALRLATPGAQLLALPAIWQFVQDVMKQLREMQPQPSQSD